MEGGGQAPSGPMSEEAAKKNTDCVYFLASPLTCKKGNECEYRHSEGARVNPRDCWFWLNGNCLNAKCSFRHPPLDGLLGPPNATQPSPSLPSTQTAMSILTAHAPATHTSNKQSIPCYYFQKGGCLKGERCPFMHDVQPSNNPVAKQTAKVDTPVTEGTSALKSTPWVLESCVQHNISKISADKPVGVSQNLTKADVKAGFSVKGGTIPSPPSNVTPHTFPPVNVACSVSDCSVSAEGHHVEPPNGHVHNGRDADESMRESSPGFDVLVDDECEDANYFHMDGRDTLGHEVNNLDVVNDFDHRHSSVYNSTAQFERVTHKIHEVNEYDRHERRDKDRQEDCRYSERTRGRASIHEKRSSHGEDCANEIDGSDLRHRLLKKRKVNGLRSAISADHHGEPYQKDDQYAEKQGYHSRNSGRDQHHFPREGSVSKRLQGRITLPGRPPSDNTNNVHSERETHKGKDWARSSSPAQPLNYQGRLHDRTARSMHEARNIEGQPRNEVDSLNFAGPKSLAELKGARFSNDARDRLPKIDNGTVTQEQKNLRLNKALGLNESEVSVSFEGPKPLSEILKKKREATLGNDAKSSNGRESNQKVIEGHVGSPMMTAVADSQNIGLLESQNKECHNAGETEVLKSTSVEEEGPSMADGEELSPTEQAPAKKETLEGGDDRLTDNVEDQEIGAYDQRDEEFEFENKQGTDFKTKHSEELLCPDQSSHKEEMLESEDGMLVDNVEDSEENYDQGDELEYDVVEDTDFRTYDENDEKDEDNVDDEEDEDDDEFARKIGVMFS